MDLHGVQRVPGGDGLGGGVLIGFFMGALYIRPWKLQRLLCVRDAEGACRAVRSTGAKRTPEQPDPAR